MNESASATAMPEKTCGRAPGSTMRQRYSTPRISSARALSRCRPSSAWAPAAVLRNTGQKPPMKTTKIAESRKVGRTAIAYGMYTVGGTGAATRANGKKARRSHPVVPTRRPTAIPSTTAPVHPGTRMSSDDHGEQDRGLGAERQRRPPGAPRLGAPGGGGRGRRREIGHRCRRALEVSGGELLLELGPVGVLRALLRDPVERVLVDGHLDVRVDRVFRVDELARL